MQTIVFRLFLASVGFMTLVSVASAQGQRLTDKDVKELIEQIDHGRDRFEDALDDRLKHSIIRGPSGEVKVDQFTDDFQKNVKRLKERYTDSYAASTEAQTVLRQATDINRFIKSQPSEMKGGSEWDRLAIDLNRLAEAYGTTFPLPDGAAVRRINDDEAAQAAEAVAKQADRVKSEVNKDKALTKDQKDMLKKELDDLSKQAKLVKSRAAGSKPATAEARQLIDLSSKIGGGFAGASPAVLTAWGSLRAPLEKLEQAFGVN
jgi:hypothetical protein